MSDRRNFDNKTANISTKKCSLSIVLTATGQKPQNHENVTLISIMLTFKRRDGG